jgi:hypothetical protein
MLDSAVIVKISKKLFEGFEVIDEPGLREGVLRSDLIEIPEGACNADGVGLLEGFDFVRVAIAVIEGFEDTLGAALEDALDDALEDALEDALNAALDEIKLLLEGFEVIDEPGLREGVLRSDRIEFPEGACNADADANTKEVAVILGWIAGAEEIEAQVEADIEADIEAEADVEAVWVGCTTIHVEQDR